MEITSNAHNFFIFLRNFFEIFTICRGPPLLQTDANVGMMKIVVRETDACKVRGGELHPDNTSVSVGTISMQNLKIIRAFKRA